jgi:FkbM family methyltransferase
MLKKTFVTIITFPLYLFNKTIDFLSLFNAHFKKTSYDYQLNYLDHLIEKVSHSISRDKDIDMKFFTPNSLCLYRAESFSSKEPETLEWIKEFGNGAKLFFDIGANVGLYSIYHSKLNDGKCFAFEPSCFNLKILTKNININNCQDLISIISNPLSNKTGLSEFRYGSEVEGGALSAFGVNYGFDGMDINAKTKSNVLGFTLDWMLDNSIIKIPTLVKMDVDGIEHLILQGAKNTLSHPDCKSILVEVNDDFKEQAEKVKSLLSSYNFTLRNKLHGQSTEESQLFSRTYNQIWIKT